MRKAFFRTADIVKNRFGVVVAVLVVSWGCGRGQTPPQGQTQTEAGAGGGVHGAGGGVHGAGGVDGSTGNYDGGATGNGTNGDAESGDVVPMDAPMQTALDAAGQAEVGAFDPGWQWNGVVGTGQSLSVGAASTATLTAQPFRNMKLAIGTANISVPPYNANDSALSLVALVEPIRAPATGYPSAYPLNIYGETPHTAMANEISALYQKARGADYVTIHTVVGESGQGIAVIDKTATVTPNMGHAYAATLFEIKALTRLAAAAGKTYGVGAVILTHGETDGGNANYESAILKLIRDYSADISAITGQTKKIPLLVTQQQTSPGDNTTTASLVAQWKVGVDYPMEAVCVGPKYQYAYAGDHLHLVANGYDQLGEKYAEVYYEKVVLGRDWQPLQPISVSRAGSVITVRFHVPVPPLVWDANMPAPHLSVHTAWSNGRGFEVANQIGEQTITSVAIQGGSVVIALASDPQPTGLVVRYALTQDGSGSLGGLATGRIGQLRDSDALIGYATKLPQYNYAVSFVLPVN